MDREKMKQIANYYGWFQQLLKANEELAEVIAEIAKCQSLWMNDGQFRYERVHLETNLIEEIADAKLMLDQLEYLLSAEISVDNFIKYKLERQLGRIEAEQEMERKGNRDNVNGTTTEEKR